MPDYHAPVILPKKRNRVEDFCNKIHRALLKDFKYAIIWGTSVKHQPMKVIYLFNKSVEKIMKCKMKMSFKL